MPFEPLIIRFAIVLALRRRFFLTALLWVALASSPALAASPRYHFNVWTTENGLPHNSIEAIHQTRDGYLWLTTPDGLARFDGVRFTIFNTANTKGIKSNRFTCVFEDDTGALWMLNSAGVRALGLERAPEARTGRLFRSDAWLRDRIGGELPDPGLDGRVRRALGQAVTGSRSISGA